jgi:serine phosphatase RsbU (regulator of sigma subunit)
MSLEGQYLLVTRPGQPQENVGLAPGREYTLGRVTENEIVLSDGSISRRHARIFPRDDCWWVEDLGSKNGTKLNGRVLAEPAKLTPGDRIELGQHYAVDFSGQPSTGSARLADVVVPGNIRAVSVADIMGAAPTDTRSAAVQGLPPQRVGYFLQTMDRVGRELLVVRPLEDLYKFVVELTSDVVRADRSVLLRRDPSSDELLVKAVRYGGSGLGGEIVVSRGIARKTVEERQAILTSDAMHDPRFMEHQSIIRQRIHSAMCVPLWHEDDVLGLLYVDNIAAPYPFAEEDLRILTLIGHLAAVKISETEKADEAKASEALKEEARRASAIQQGLLPREPLVREPFQVAGRNLPSQSVGGDYFDFIECEGGGICIGLGDVAGKGMSAALLMANLHANVRAQVETDRPLPDMVARVNRSIHQAVKGQRFITLVLAALDPATGAIRYVNAGHNPPLLLRADDRVESLGTGGFLLGVFPDAVYELGEVSLDPGDLLVLYSDGVTEAMDPSGEEFGEERLTAFLREHRALPPEELVDSLIARVRDFSQGKQGDDITVAALRRA